MADSSWRVAMRSDYSAYGSGGVACFNSSDVSDIYTAHIGSRIQYRGSIQVIEDPAEFIELPVGF